MRAAGDLFRLLSGTPTIYVKTADSGAKRAHAFCATCGSPIYATSVDAPQSYSLRVGALDRRHELPPREQKWCASVLGWSNDLSDLPRIERQ